MTPHAPYAAPPPLMSRDAQAVWERIAKLAPYYCVLSSPQFLNPELSGSFGAFFETGDREVARLLETIRSSGRKVDVRRVVEFGCGPGRLLPALARRGFHVTAVDLSPSMLELARANVERFELADSIEFLELRDFLQQSDAFDLIIATRMLQHVVVDEGLAYVRQLLRRLRPGGFLFLNAPFASARGLASRAALAMRRRVPPLNRIANRMKHRAAAIPLLVPQVYSLDQLVLALHAESGEIVSFEAQTENELTTAHVLVARGVIAAADGGRPDLVGPARAEGEPPVDSIAPEELIRSVGIDTLNARAEQYFARGDDWTQQLAKPFSSPTEAPAMLISLGVVLQGARIVPGMTVVDFGGGTGWLSRFLLQFGCRVVLVDVSPSALKIATDFIERQPPVGGNPADFQVALFDGYHLDLPDQSVDRILCFDSFHHVPNIEAALSEFGRVLKPGGLAAFSEPGPEHSRSAQSQFEMRVHGVLENDVDVRRIWNVARTSGFEELRLAAFNGAPEFVTLAAFEELLAGGPTLSTAARSLREFTANVRTFTLRKAGVEKTDSRVATGLACKVTIELQAEPRIGAPTPFTARIVNTGSSEWLPSRVSRGGVSLGAHLYGGDGALLDFDFFRVPISDDTFGPNVQVIVHGVIPPLQSGRYVVEFDCVANNVTWFAQAGSKATPVDLEPR